MPSVTKEETQSWPLRYDLYTIRLSASPSQCALTPCNNVRPTWVPASRAQFVPQLILGSALDSSSGPPDYKPAWHTHTTWAFGAHCKYGFVWSLSVCASLSVRQRSSIVSPGVQIAPPHKVTDRATRPAASSPSVAVVLVFSGAGAHTTGLLSELAWPF